MEFIRACEEIAESVTDAVADLTGVPAGGDAVKMGADGTPTKRIDQVAEDAVIAYLREDPLCRTLVSEEAGVVGMDGEAGTIYLDPIDGTYNAVIGIPFYALSIAYAHDGILQKGYVRNLATGETFSAVRGMGAFLDGEPIRVSRTCLLEESAMSVYGRRFDPAPVLHLGRKLRRWRLFGASALELCYVGAGRIDGFIDFRGTLRVTDAAAGIVVCEEAGGRATGLEGGSLRFGEDVTTGYCLVATNSVIHNKVIEYLR
ncbi:bifunctional fructose-bisphosphatase/inositol-phosphate phosphatase [Methanoculleus sp. FWC-SCC1]|uniref:fructose-bisphosphatase n=1 Tax=Methanoculleus frigidifontis TaxID=2584085 RepID=A0ABT8M659_9EURY|nr:bifunctional fructose-bisphosphatase/inositol-phosphate phosphatase [Methanoculleus sp. FWC-SCC1]MDN7023374.1 bifunctional fructose-bisphosphatase/inositol-phosphate phosphatase [Methanoculleus sp. FWC-SCC1]